VGIVETGRSSRRPTCVIWPSQYLLMPFPFCQKVQLNAPYCRWYFHNVMSQVSQMYWACDSRLTVNYGSVISRTPWIHLPDYVALLSDQLPSSLILHASRLTTYASPQYATTDDDCMQHLTFVFHHYRVQCTNGFHENKIEHLRSEVYMQFRVFFPTTTCSTSSLYNAEALKHSLTALCIY